MPNDIFAADVPDRVDVELPMGPSLPVDIALDQSCAGEPQSGFRPTLSQVAGQLPRARVRWPGRSRSGYHGTDSWNWMRDGEACFGDRVASIR